MDLIKAYREYKTKGKNDFEVFFTEPFLIYTAKETGNEVNLPKGIPYNPDFGERSGHYPKALFTTTAYGRNWQDVARLAHLSCKAFSNNDCELYLPANATVLLKIDEEINGTIGNLNKDKLTKRDQDKIWVYIKYLDVFEMVCQYSFISDYIEWKV